MNGAMKFGLVGNVVRLTSRVSRVSLLGPPLSWIVELPEMVVFGVFGSDADALRVAVPVAWVLLKRKLATPPLTTAVAVLPKDWLAPAAAPTWPRFDGATLRVTVWPLPVGAPLRTRRTWTSVIDPTPKVVAAGVTVIDAVCGGWIAPPESLPPPPQATSARQEMRGTSLSRARFIVFSKLLGASKGMGAGRHCSVSRSNLGVTKISSSALLDCRCLLRNRLPRTGTSPSRGTFCRSSRELIS
jgi:hypothetical protein